MGLNPVTLALMTRQWILNTVPLFVHALDIGLLTPSVVIMGS